MRHFLSTKPWWTIGSLGAYKPETGTRQVRMQAADSTAKLRDCGAAWVDRPRTACCCNSVICRGRCHCTDENLVCRPAAHHVHKRQSIILLNFLSAKVWPAVGTQERLTVFLSFSGFDSASHGSPLLFSISRHKPESSFRSDHFTFPKGFHSHHQDPQLS